MFIEFEGISNFRDLGGLTRPDGATVKKDMLLRSGHLAGATQKDIERLAEMGVHFVVDFRDTRECQRDPDRPIPGSKRRHIPALSDLGTLFSLPVGQTTPTQAHEGFQALYRYLATAAPAHDAYERFFQTLLASDGKPVLWHCTQGKDRTGVAAMLLLTALGLDRETVVEEYLLTNQAMENELARLRDESRSEEYLALAREVLLVFPENARLYFQCLELEYGSADNYLELALGIGPAEREKLERLYLT